MNGSQNLRNYINSRAYSKNDNGKNSIKTPCLEDIIMILTQIIVIIPGVLVEEMVMSIHQEIQRQDQVPIGQIHPSTRSSNSSSLSADHTITAHPHLVVFLPIAEDLHQVPPDLVEL